MTLTSTRVPCLKPYGTHGEPCALHLYQTPLQMWQTACDLGYSFIDGQWLWLIRCTAVDSCYLIVHIEQGTSQECASFLGVLCVNMGY